MFRSRSRLQKKDRESGLAFNWRVPVSSTGMFILAFLLVSGAAVALGLAVRIKFGEDREIPENRATLVLVPADAGGAWLERQAIEAGPFPSRWNPETDPSLAELREQLLIEAEAASGAKDYEPGLTPITFRPWQVSAPKPWQLMTLPPLPDPPTSTAPLQSPEVTLAVRMVSGKTDGPGFEIVGLPVPAEQGKTLLGTRFLIGYEADGGIREVVPLETDERGTTGLSWVHRGRVTRTNDNPGWAVVEFVLK